MTEKKDSYLGATLIAVSFGFLWMQIRMAPTDFGTGSDSEVDRASDGEAAAD